MPFLLQINVFLRVVGKRMDGYHDLASLFHVIDLGDNMTFTPLPASAEADELTCNVEGVPTDDSNLVIKVGTLCVGLRSLSKPPCQCGQPPNPPRRP